MVNIYVSIYYVHKQINISGYLLIRFIKSSRNCGIVFSACAHSLTNARRRQDYKNFERISNMMTHKTLNVPLWSFVS